MARPIPIRDQIALLNQRKKRQGQQQAITGLLGGGVKPGAAAMPAAPAPSAAMPAAPAPAAATGGKGKFDWGDGKGRVHSISLAATRRNRAVNANNKNPLYDPTQQLSGDSLKSAAGDLVNLEFGPQRAALERELANTTTQGTALAGRAADYSKQLATTDAALPGQVTAIGQLLGEKLTANTAAAQTGIDSALAGTRERAAADAELSGLSLPGVMTAGAEAEAQAQTGRLAELGKASQDAAAGTTANYAGLAAISGAARAQMGNEVQGQLLTQLANQQGDVRGRQADLAAQEGPALSAKVGSLRQQGFENLITQAGLDIKTKDLEAQTKEGQDKLALDKAKLAETAKARRQRARDAAASRTLKREADQAARDGKASEINSFGIPNGEWKGMTTTQRQRAISDFNKQKTADTTRPSSSADKETAKAVSTRSGIDNALVDIQNDPKLQRHVGETGPRLAQILTNRGAPPIVAQAAAEIARYGSLKPGTVEMLKRSGVKVPDAWLPKGRLPNASGPDPVAALG